MHYYYTITSVDAGPWWVLTHRAHVKANEMGDVNFMCLIILYFLTVGPLASSDDRHTWAYLHRATTATRGPTCIERRPTRGPTCIERRPTRGPICVERRVTHNGQMSLSGGYEYQGLTAMTITCHQLSLL